MRNENESATERFENLYREGPAWEIDGPQPEVMALQESGRIHSRVLDAGCGTGHNAIWLAKCGHDVVAIDFIAAPLDVARRRGRDAGVDVDWRQFDALRLGELDESFRTIVDSGLFHVFPDEIRGRYVDGLRHVLADDGVLHIICFSDRQPGTEGPLRISEADLRRDFQEPWEISELVATRYACRLVPGGPVHDGNGAHAWRATIRINRNS